MGMNIEGFINALYEKTNSGALGVSYIKPGNAPVTKWFTRDQLDDMAAFIRKCGKQYNTYININPRQNALDTCHRGESTDISEVVGLYMDFDIKGEAHKEKRLPEKAEELQAFIHQLSMKPSIIVVSGNGIHCYWLLKESFQIKSDDDREYISGLLSGYEQYVSEQAYSLHGWNFDHVADLARMLRAPETTNFKTSDKLQCRIIEASDTRYDPSDFEAYAKRLLSEKRATSTVSDDADSFSLMGTGSARELIDICRFLQHCRDDAVSLSEPDWYAAITNLAQTADGHDVIHEISSPYPGYSYQETERKYIHAAKEDKPVTCDRIKHVHCFDCGKDCGVRAPIALIRTEQPAAPGEWEEPIPFDEFKLPSFPVDALPDVIGDYVSAVAESTQTPVDLPATCALSVMATAEQGKYEIWPKEDWCEPLCLDEMSIMRPSERKSAVLNHMIKPLNKYETEYNFQNAPAFEMSQVRKRLLERQQKALEDQVSKGKADMAELEKVVGELSRFEEKVPLKLYLDDVTTEKLVSVLAQNKGHAAILSTEGGIFDMLSGIYTKTVNIDVILKAYSGDSIRVDRIGRESETIMKPTLTMHLMAQPSVLSGLMENKTFRGRGLTARFLYSLPSSFVGQRRYRSKVIPEEVYQNYEQCIVNLLQEEYPPRPEHITLSPEADRMIESFAEDLEGKLNNEYADISDWAGKLVGNTLRIAGLLCRASVERYEAFLDEPEPLIVSGEIMGNAIRIADYFTAHARAAFSLMGADGIAQQCKYVLAAIKDNGLVEFKRRDIMRLCRSFKKADDLQPVSDHLTEYGYIAPDGKTVWSGKGRPPAQMYRVNPRIFEA